MRFTKTFEYENIKEKLNDIYESVTYNWSEYDPSVCDPEDENKLKELGENLNTKLEEIQQIIEKMSYINKESFGC